MRHEEALYKAPEYREGRLSPRDKAEVDRHLKGCAECRGLFAAWRLEEPSNGFVEAVMRDLGRVVVLDAEARDEASFWGRMPWWGAVAAMLLIGLVFFKPERDWVQADRSFAWLGAPTTDETETRGVIWKGEAHE